MATTLVNSMRSVPQSVRCRLVPRGRVCLVIMRPVCDDVRAQRTIQSLRHAGYHVSIVDVIEYGRRRAKFVAGSTLWHLHVPAWRAAQQQQPVHFLLQTLSLFIQALWLLLFLHADIYHACDATALPACYLAACLRRKRLVYEAYELPLHDIPRADQSCSRTCWRLGLSLLLPSMLARCVAVITVSPPIAAALQRRYHLAHVVLIRNMPPHHQVTPTDLLRSHLGLPATTRIALYQGYLQTDRGLDLLVHAARYLAPDIVIVLMGQGRGETITSLASLIASEHVADRVRILPPVPYASLLSWTASADLGLVLTPAHLTLNMRYSLPNKLFEYLMAGLPVLAAPLPAVSDIVSHYAVGEVVSDLLPQTVGAALSRLLGDERALATYRSHALTAARECCWEQEQEKLLALYRSVLDHR